MATPEDDLRLMSLAIAEARAAYAAGEVPVGAVIARQEQIIARARNEVETRKDALAHAEILAIAQAQRHVGDWRLSDCVLYVTKEPCPMCAGALANCRIMRVVFGAGDPRWGAAGGALNLLQFPGSYHQCLITAGVAESECRDLLVGFFRQARNR
jgi:tRNA(adenine34) deaminase